jgi:hypothetical protein
MLHSQFAQQTRLPVKMPLQHVRALAFFPARRARQDQIEMNLRAHMLVERPRGQCLLALTPSAVHPRSPIARDAMGVAQVRQEVPESYDCRAPVPVACHRPDVVLQRRLCGPDKFLYLSLREVSSARAGASRRLPYLRILHMNGEPGPCALGIRSATASLSAYGATRRGPRGAVE